MKVPTYYPFQKIGTIITTFAAFLAIAEKASVETPGIVSENFLSCVFILWKIWSSKKLL